MISFSSLVTQNLSCVCWWEVKVQSVPVLKSQENQSGFWSRPVSRCRMDSSSINTHSENENTTAYLLLSVNLTPRKHTINSFKCYALETMTFNLCITITTLSVQILKWINWVNWGDPVSGERLGNSVGWETTGAADYFINCWCHRNSAEEEEKVPKYKTKI